MSRGVGLVGVPVTNVGGAVPSTGALVAAAATAGVTVTVGTSNTPGSWFELVAATVAEGSFINLSIFGAGTTGTSLPALLDIGIGAAASETVLVPSVAMGQTGTGSFVIPVRIPAGSRVSVRITSSAATVAVSPVVRCWIYGKDPRSIGKITNRVAAIGADAANSTGVAISSNDTWTQIVAATTEPYQALVMSYTMTDLATSSSSDVLTLGVGTSGAELTLGAYFIAVSASESWVNYTPFLPIARHIPTGTRLAAKSLLGASNVGAVVVLGIPYA